MRLFRLLCLSCVVVLAFATTSHADAGTMKLANMIKYSDLIVVGKVINAKADGKTLAELVVTQTLKGDSSLKTVRFYAVPFWACDVSGAKDNEVGIFFLRRNFTDDPAEKALPQDFSDGVPIFFIAHSGRGRIIFQYIDGEDFVYAHKRGDVRFPDKLKFARYPDSQDPDLGLIKVVDVLAYVRSKV